MHRMAENPYESPSAESSTQQSALVKASRIKPCPSCGEDVGVWAFVRMAFSFPPTHIKCPNCGTWLYCGGRMPGYVLISLPFLGVATIIVRFSQLWVTTSWLTATGYAATMAVVFVALQVALALIVRRYTELTVGL
ncbi:MAG TPA: hypothetical protein VMP01_23700 [Pirellulaceae bacterium]|nr:hypothetical protein [Pirellulaceae bacterium]